MFCRVKATLFIFSIALFVLGQGCDNEPQITKDSTSEEILEYKRWVAEKKLKPGMDRKEMFYLLGSVDAVEIKGTQYDVNAKKSYTVRIYWYFDVATVKVINDKIVEVTLIKS